MGKNLLFQEKGHAMLHTSSLKVKVVEEHTCKSYTLRGFELPLVNEAKN